MFQPWTKRIVVTAFLAFLFSLLSPSPSLHACACGCQIFDVGIGDMPDSLHQNRLTVGYAYMNQNLDQSGSQLVSSGLNPDKQLESAFYSVDYSRQFNRDWGMDLDIPFVQRNFTTDVNGTPDQIDPSPDLQSQGVFTMGDVRIQGMYTGFSKDMSVGLTFGLKLPTGPFDKAWLMDRDTDPGTGTTDLLLGAFDRGSFNSAWGWYAQTLLDAALYERDGYQPGNNLDVEAGLHFDGIYQWTRLTPLLQANVSIRGHDSGGGDSLVVEQGYANFNSGYENLYLTPGLQAQLGTHLQATAFVYLPVSRNVNGDQLVASWLTSGSLSYLF